MSNTFLALLSPCSNVGAHAQGQAILSADDLLYIALRAARGAMRHADTIRLIVCQSIYIHEANIFEYMACSDFLAAASFFAHSANVSRTSFDLGSSSLALRRSALASA